MGLSIVDYMTGITLAVAVLSALIGVARDGRGRDIDVSLFDVALHQLTYPGNWYLNEGHRTERLPRSSHRRRFRCSCSARATAGSSSCA
jgi:crotonobetainyl-CoA:carnitine CoA-transferase CaiB-like acyl-CoA transferase